MIDLKVLASFGTTNEALKSIFTAESSDDLKNLMTFKNDRWQAVPTKKGDTAARIELAKKARENARLLNLRERFRAIFQGRAEEGIVQSLKNWKLYAAVDLAWDTSAISGMTLPLMMYAQKKINVERAAQLLQKLDGNGKEFIKKDETGKIASIDVPRFVECNVNIIRSVVTRRHSAQVNKFNQLWPYYEYEPRSTGIVAKCRADVLSQRMDMMVDQFGYRHHDAQCMRDAFLYGHTVDFMRSSWEVEKQYRVKDISKKPEGDNVETEITKEGVGWFNPHPSRTFYDNASSNGLASINTDDINWLGFWDVCRFSEIDDNPYYFNKQHVGWTGKFWGEKGVYESYRDYFTHYTYTIIPPSTGEVDPAKQNDRKAVVGYYSANHRDVSVFHLNMFTKLVPKDWGIGEYPWPVWIRTVNSSDGTTIFAEIMPSTPAAYLGINENDGRQVNVSPAMELFSYQDQMSNLTTLLMLLCQMELFKVITLNKDAFPGAEGAAELKRIRTLLAGRGWIGEPTIIEASLLELSQQGVDVKKAIEIAEVHAGASIQSVFEAMIKLVTMVEKLIAMSPAEQGQPAPREISATEVTEIATTTSSVYSFISESIDEFRAAKKKSCYEALIVCSQGDIVCPVKNRYTAKTITAAGFRPKEGEDEDFRSPNLKGGAKRQTVIGSKTALIHDYLFTTRDGSERPVNTQAANTLVQLLGQVLSIPGIVQAMGKSKLYEIVNEIFRMSGAGVDLNLELHEGEDDSMGQDDMAQVKQTLDQITQYLNRMGQQLQKNSQDITALDKQEEDLKTTVGHLSTLADQVKKIAGDINDLQDNPHDATMQAVTRRLVESIPYDKCPPSVQAQMEQQAGFRPAPPEERKALVKTNGK